MIDWLVWERTIGGCDLTLAAWYALSTVKKPDTLYSSTLSSILFSSIITSLPIISHLHTREVMLGPCIMNTWLNKWVFNNRNKWNHEKQCLVSHILNSLGQFAHVNTPLDSLLLVYSTVADLQLNAVMDAAEKHCVGGDTMCFGHSVFANTSLKCNRICLSALINWYFSSPFLSLGTIWII